MRKIDQNKIAKAGFATPRGGAKGAYQNHVVRSNQVIVPYEKYLLAPLSSYHNGYVVRLFPEQYFASPGIPKSEFEQPNSSLIVGVNAFVLYRTHELYTSLPPLLGWQIRHLEKEGQVINKRGRGVLDTGHYVLRLPQLSAQKVKKSEGEPQGLFAPEYADEETNYLCKCVLAWLIVHTVTSPYTMTQANHLQAVLAKAKLLDEVRFEYRGVMRRSLCSCPLCLRYIQYDQLHEMVSFEADINGNENAGIQVEGATRSTIVNLFHIHPLRYDAIRHLPENVAWGHAICNTRLGQRACWSLEEMSATERKVGILHPEGTTTFGWLSVDDDMIRSPLGAVWIQISRDMEGDEDLPPRMIDEDEGSIQSGTV